MPRTSVYEIFFMKLHIHVLPYRTIFTRANRHTYVDPDYAFVDDDDVKRFRHKDSYVQLLREMKENRLNRKRARLDMIYS